MQNRKSAILICLTIIGLALAFPCQSKESESDKADGPSLKAELRTKYKLADRQKDIADVEDTKFVLQELEKIMKTKKASTAKENETPEMVMNRKMEMANLEYEIDHLGDFIPELKAQKDKEWKEKMAKRNKEESEDDDAPGVVEKVKHPIQINEQQIKEKHGKFYTK